MFIMDSHALRKQLPSLVCPYTDLIPSFPSRRRSPLFHCAGVCSNKCWGKWWHYIKPMMAIILRWNCSCLSLSIHTSRKNFAKYSSYVCKVAIATKLFRSDLSRSCTFNTPMHMIIYTFLTDKAYHIYKN